MKYAVVKLSGSYSETASQVRSLEATGLVRSFRYDNFLIHVERILTDRSIRRVLVDTQLDFQVSFVAGLEAVRRQLERLKGAGKQLFFYARTYGAPQLYLASAAETAVIHPLGSLQFLGLFRSFLFFKRLLARHKLGVEVIRRGRYKSAGDLVRTDRIDRYNREQYEAILDNHLAELRAKIGAGLAKGPEELDSLLAGRILSAGEALEERWIHKIASRESLLAEWKKEKLSPARAPRRGGSFGKGKRIAVLVLEGSIVDGISRFDPLSGQAIGAESYLPTVERLAKDRRIKGVIFRINSPGGSAIASEEIAEALKRLGEKKPLVVSMSEVAGSGGYWIATPGERLFAEQTTLTGSIGVISMAVSAPALLAKLGITESTLRRGEHADLASPLRRLRAEERRMLESEVDRLYRAFVEKVAACRKRPVEEIDKIAEGRVWAGGDACALGLVDEIGGLTEAIAYLKGRLKIRRARVDFHPVVRRPFIERMLFRHAADAGGALLGQSHLPLFAGLRALSSLAALGDRRPLALMPEGMPGGWWLQRSGR